MLGGVQKGINQRINMKKLTYYTDGGCEPNPGKGTWAFVCVEHQYEMSGHNAETTNNIMEMTAIIRAIEHAAEQGARMVTIYSDSQYCVRGFNQWMLNWQRRDWQRLDSDTAETVPVKNVDLWKTLYEYRYKYLTSMPIDLRWVKGHAGNRYNERVDELTRIEYRKAFNGELRRN